MAPLFTEKQRFTQWWLWAIIIGIGILPLAVILYLAIFGEEIETNPSDNWTIILTVLLTVGIILLFWTMRLKTEITHTEIGVRFFPFVKKRINWKDIKSAEVINYGFVGGWGIRLGTRYGTVYNIKGDKGLAIELNNGKKFLIGTQKEAEISRAVKKITP